MTRVGRPARFAFSFASLAGIGLGLLLPAGCVHVHPYEREALSRPSMDPAEETGEAAFQAHVRESREGASANAGAAGGGCGCN